MTSDPFLGPYRDVAALQARAREVLGVGQEAGLAEIKEAFRKLARKQHPDVGGSEKAFTRVVNAYLILTKPDPLRFPLAPEAEGAEVEEALSEEDYRRWWLKRFAP